MSTLSPTQQHLSEYLDHQRKLNPAATANEDVQSIVEGFLSGLGVRRELLNTAVEYDWDEGVIFQPFLDQYWTRAGRIWVSVADVKDTRIMTWRARIAACIREAERRDESHLLFHPITGAELRGRLKFLGGTVE